MSSDYGPSYNAMVLSYIDDECTRIFIDAQEGIQGSCKTNVEPMDDVRPEVEKEIRDNQYTLYQNTLRPECKFKFEQCLRYSENGVKVVAKQPIQKGMIVEDLCGQYFEIRDEHIKPGKMESAILQLKGKDHLLLGPIYFINHSCVANVRLNPTFDNKTSAICIKKISPGEEITAFYGAGYFGKNNEECGCRQCEAKQKGKYQKKTEPQGYGRSGGRSLRNRSSLGDRRTTD